MEITFAGTTIHLLPQKALFLPEHSLLVLGDLHLGKAMHFRKAGIFMPAASAADDYGVLQHLMQQYQPRQVFFLGDLFHSLHNSEWLRFAAWIATYPDTRFTLIRGNHDILDDSEYGQIGLRVVEGALRLGDLIFAHEPMAEVPEGTINIAGHIHPGCVLRGRGRQSLTLPCFYQSGPTFLLPAFGKLTGLHVLSRYQATRVFAVLPERVVAV